MTSEPYGPEDGALKMKYPDAASSMGTEVS